MGKEQFQKAMMLYNTGAISLPEFTEFCMTYIKELEQRVEVLTYMSEPKTCDGCVYEELKKENGGCCTIWCQRDFGQDQYTPKATS